MSCSHDQLTTLKSIAEESSVLIIAAMKMKLLTQCEKRATCETYSYSSPRLAPKSRRKILLKNAKIFLLTKVKFVLEHVCLSSMPIVNWSTVTQPMILCQRRLAAQCGLRLNLAPPTPESRACRWARFEHLQECRNEAHQEFYHVAGRKHPSTF
jgi:hypothetical protein